MYLELHAASAFSFLQGASLPEALIERAAALGYPAVALLDADGVYGAPRFHKAAARAGLRAIIGAELTMARARKGGGGRAGGTGRAGKDAGRGFSPAGAPTGDHTWRLPVLVASAEGYKNICRLVTRMKMRAEKGAGALAIEDSTASPPASSPWRAGRSSTRSTSASAACSIGSSDSSAAATSTSICSVTSC